VCQTISVGAAALTGILPVAVPEPEALQPIPAASSPSAAQTASIGGTMCKKLGQIRKTSAGSFRCTAVGKQKTWRPLQSAATTSTTTSTTSIPATSSETEFAPVIECKLPKPANLPGDDGAMGSVGFPRNAAQIASEGSHKGLLLLIDFPDIVAGSNLRPTFEDWQIPLVEQLFESASYGRFTLDIVPSQKVYRIDKPSTEYNLIEAPEGGPLPGVPVRLNDLLLDAMTLADRDINFSEYAFVSLAAPISARFTLSGAFGVSSLQMQRFDGAQFQFASFSPLDAVLPKEQYNKIWNWSHDIGHMLGLMHPYARGVQNAWDIMYSFAPQPDFLGWNKWKLNWISDNQVACLTKSSRTPLTVLLTPVGNKTEGKKLLMAKLGPATAIAIEVRRATRLDKSGMQASDEGTIVYRVDTSKSADSGPFELVSNPTKTSPGWNQFVVGTMKPGEVTVIEGLEIRVLQSTAVGDYVSIRSRD